MSSPYQILLQQVAELQRQLGQLVRPATVKTVKGDKMRMVLGKDKEGKEVLGPWLNTSNQRGGARERRFYKEGQNIMLLCPGGDVRQAIVMPYAPNKDHPAPEHANSSGQDEESYQLDNFREKQTKDGDDSWLQEDDQQQQGQGQQSSGGQQQQQNKQGHVGGEKATVKRRMNKDGGHTLRVGAPSEAMRSAVHKKGVKFKNNKTKDWAMITDKGDLIISKPWEIGPDTIPDDDA